MKKVIFFTLFLSTSIFILSCSDEKDILIDHNAQDSVIQQKSLSFGLSQLFTYTSDSEASDSIRTVFSQFTDEIENELHSRTDITHIVIHTSIGGGTGNLLGIYYVDMNTNTIVEEGLANPSTGNIDIAYPGTPIFDVFTGEPVNPILGQLRGRCPQGYSSIGECAYSGDALAYSSCTGAIIANYQMNNMGSNNSCIVTAGLASGTVCVQSN